MVKNIHAGTVLLAEGTPLPQRVAFVVKPYLFGWSYITGMTVVQLAKQTSAAGWSLFYMAGEIQAKGFGFGAAREIRRAMAHIIEMVGLERCNCLEVTQVIRGRFLGVLPYTRVVAQARHIQKSYNFNDLPIRSERMMSRSARTPLEAVVEVNDASLV